MNPGPVKQPEATAFDPDDQVALNSPCMGVCEMDPRHGWCLGCYRTMDEITDWFRFDDEKKRAILARVNQRMADENSSR